MENLNEVYDNKNVEDELEYVKEVLNKGNIIQLKELHSLQSLQELHGSHQDDIYPYKYGSNDKNKTMMNNQKIKNVFKIHLNEADWKQMFLRIKIIKRYDYNCK
eukprot:108192_1